MHSELRYLRPTHPGASSSLLPGPSLPRLPPPSPGLCFVREMNLRILQGEREGSTWAGMGSSPGDTALWGCEEDAIMGVTQRVKRHCQTSSVTAKQSTRY